MKTIDEPFDAGIDVSQQHAGGHRQKDPDGQETIEEGKPAGWIAILAGHVIGDSGSLAIIFAHAHTIAHRSTRIEETVIDACRRSR